MCFKYHKEGDPSLSGRRDHASSCSCSSLRCEELSWLGPYLALLARIFCKWKFPQWHFILSLRAVSAFLGVWVPHRYQASVACLGACRVVAVFPGKGGKEFSRFERLIKLKGVLYLWGHLSPCTCDFQRSVAHILPWPLLGLSFSQQVSSLQENLRFFFPPPFLLFCSV